MASQAYYLNLIIFMLSLTLITTKLLTQVHCRPLGPPKPQPTEENGSEKMVKYFDLNTKNNDKNNQKQPAKKMDLKDMKNLPPLSFTPFPFQFPPSLPMPDQYPFSTNPFNTPLPPNPFNMPLPPNPFNMPLPPFPYNLPFPPPLNWPPLPFLSPPPP